MTGPGPAAGGHRPGWRGCPPGSGVAAGSAWRRRRRAPCPPHRRRGSRTRCGRRPSRPWRPPDRARPTSPAAPSSGRRTAPRRPTSHWRLRNSSQPSRSSPRTLVDCSRACTDERRASVEMRTAAVANIIDAPTSAQPPPSHTTTRPAATSPHQSRDVRAEGEQRVVGRQVVAVDQVGDNPGQSRVQHPRRDAGQRPSGTAPRWVPSRAPASGPVPAAPGNSPSRRPAAPMSGAAGPPPRRPPAGTARRQPLRRRARCSRSGRWRRGGQGRRWPARRA